jgi:hypothetical protein
MPELSRFLGIVIGIFSKEHPPAHFHAVYGKLESDPGGKTWKKN